MSQDFKQAALDYHQFPKPGKISVELTKPAQTSHDLSLAYSPGVAEPVKEIAADPENAYKYLWLLSRLWKVRVCCSNALPA